MMDGRRCWVSVSVFEENGGDSKMLLPQVNKARKACRLDRLVMASDRGVVPTYRSTRCARTHVGS
jgi:hypothetical protein